MRRRIGIVAVMVGLLAATAAPVWGQRPALAMLDGLQKGRWELRSRGDAAGPRSICLRDGREMIQLRHQSATCESLVVEDTPSQVIVQYTCPGQGYGRTRIRRETGQLVQVDTQGIVDGSPFAFAAEARWAGHCGQ